jgi:hypothetical protein
MDLNRPRTLEIVQDKMPSILTSSVVSTYISNLRSKNTEDAASMCSLLTRKVSHSTNIRLGNELESILNLYATAHIPAEDLRPKNVKKGEHQLDWLRRFPNSIVYGEFKSNINLDTEKRKATIEKIISVGNDLVKVYPGETVMPFLVSLRFLRYDDIPPHMAKNYSGVKLIGVADFFEEVLEHSLDEFKSYPAYTKFLMAIVDQLEPAE